MKSDLSINENASFFWIELWKYKYLVKYVYTIHDHLMNIDTWLKSFSIVNLRFSSIMNS